MNDKKKGVVLPIALAVIGILVIFSLCQTSYDIVEELNEMPYCTLEGVYSIAPSITGEYSCCIDCESLNKTFFKHNPGGFGSSSCFCRANNTIERIW